MAKRPPKVYTKQEDWTDALVIEAIKLFKFNDWKFSPSQAGCYRTCSWLWALKYICNMRETHTFLGTLVGTAFHSLMERKALEPDWFNEVMASASSKNELRLYCEKQIHDLIAKQAKLGVSIRWSKPYSQVNKIIQSQGKWEQYLIEGSSRKMVEWLTAVPSYTYDKSGIEEKVSGEICGEKMSGYLDFNKALTVQDELIFGDYKTTYSFGYFHPKNYLNQMAIYSKLTGIPKCHMVVCSRHEKDSPPVKVIEVNFSKEQLEKRMYDIGMCLRGIREKVFIKPNAAVSYDWKAREEKVGNDFCHKVCGFRKFCWNY